MSDYRTALYRDVTLPEDTIEHLRNLAEWLSHVERMPRRPIFSGENGRYEPDWLERLQSVIDHWDANDATEILV